MYSRCTAPTYAQIIAGGDHTARSRRASPTGRTPHGAPAGKTTRQTRCGDYHDRVTTRRSRTRTPRRASLAWAWVGVVLIGLTVMLGEQALARFGLWVAVNADSGTPCGQVMCSCPSTQLARIVAETSCGGNQPIGHACVLCGRGTAPDPGPVPQPELARSIDSDQPGLMLMAAFAPLVLVANQKKHTVGTPDRGERTMPTPAAHPRSRSLGVDPQPPRHA